MKGWIWVILFLSLSANVGSAQEEYGTTPIGHEVFKDISDKIEYKTERRALKLKDRYISKPEKKEYDPVSPPKKRANNFGGFFQIIAYFLIFILVLVVLYLVFSNVKIEKKIEPTLGDINDIDDIEEVNARKGYEEALARGDFRFALRMQFIYILQELYDANLIKWKPEKTNRDYTFEIKDRGIKSEFRKVAGIYEFIWYGNTEIDKEVFEKLNPSFTNLIERLN